MGAVALSAADRQQREREKSARMRTALAVIPKFVTERETLIANRIGVGRDQDDCDEAISQLGDVRIGIAALTQWALDIDNCNQRTLLIVSTLLKIYEHNGKIYLKYNN